MLQYQATPISLHLTYNNNNNIVVYIQITRLFMLVYKLSKLHERPKPACKIFCFNRTFQQSRLFPRPIVGQIPEFWQLLPWSTKEGEVPRALSDSYCLYLQHPKLQVFSFPRRRALPYEMQLQSGEPCKWAVPYLQPEESPFPRTFDRLSKVLKHLAKKGSTHSLFPPTLFD